LRRAPHRVLEYRELGEELRAGNTRPAAFSLRRRDPIGDWCTVPDRARRLSRPSSALLRSAAEKRSIVRERISLLAQMDYIARR